MWLDYFIIYGLVFVLGITIGSFLNVCIYRIPEKMSIIKPRSRCGSCGHTLTAWELIPIFSWLILKGKCHNCNSTISVRYPLVELLEGLIFLLVFHKFGVSVLTLVFWLFFAIMTAVFFIDLDHKIIPNKVVIFATIVGFIPVGLHYTMGYDFYSDGLLEPLKSALIPSGVMLIIALLSVVLFRKVGIGMGDVKVYIPIGLFIGWRLSLLSIWLAFFLGGTFGVLWIVVFRKSKNAYIPFAPFIVIGTLVSVLLGESILKFILVR
ncbi:MAG: hypothetical protein BGO41_05430 [Clostridiales bacterium 38-18]|nr:MAG: hypothetical protein BGO41_05430 [Clostridiales bacterium 38-18]